MPVILLSLFHWGLKETTLRVCGRLRPFPLALIGPSSPIGY